MSTSIAQLQTTQIVAVGEIGETDPLTLNTPPSGACACGIESSPHSLSSTPQNTPSTCHTLRSSQLSSIKFTTAPDRERLSQI